MLDFYIWNSLLVWHFEIEVEANRTWCRVRWMVGGWLECKYSNIWEWYGAARQMKMIEAELCPLLYFESSRIKIKLVLHSLLTWHLAWNLFKSVELHLLRWKRRAYFSTHAQRLQASKLGKSDSGFVKFKTNPRSAVKIYKHQFVEVKYQVWPESLLFYLNVKFQNTK